MNHTDAIPVLIFALIVMAVGVFLVMSAFVVGPVARLKRGEKLILALGSVGIGGIIAYAASELLLHVVF